MENMSYHFIIGASIIIIISYLFNLIAQKTRIPSVLMLIGLGMLLKVIGRFFGFENVELFPVLEILGIVGVIMIVLEAALDLKLSRKKRTIIMKALWVSLFSLVLNGIFCALVIKYALQGLDFLTALLYALPISIVSSAIVIPSVGHLSQVKKEFLIYESTLSDILGIMVFYFILGSLEASSTAEIGLSVTGNIIITLVVSLVLSFLLIIGLQKLTTVLKLFLLVAILLLLYSVGKLFHISSLLIILIFGLALSNPQFFFKGKLKRFMHLEKLEIVYKDLQVLTIETSFVVRTFFFVVFGLFINLSSLLSLKILGVSITCLAIIFGVRYLVLWIFNKGMIKPEVFIAPRGLISILLFFAIPEEFLIPDFKSGVLLFVIVFTSVIMAISLVHHGNGKNQNKNKSDSREVRELKKDIL